MPVTIEAMKACVDIAWTAFVTDMICSFNAEIRYVWKARPCLLTMCFLAARYITLINLTFTMAMFHGSWTESTCNRLYLIMPILTTLGLACAEAICCMRIFALNHRSRSILSLLTVLFTGMVGIQSYAISEYSAFRDDRGSCIAAGQGVWLALYWLAPAVLDLTLLLLAVYAVVRETRQHGANRLLEVILRDQLFYFLFVFSGCVVSAVLMTVNRSTVQSLANPPCVATAAIGATRLILNLKAEGRKQAGLHARGGDTGSSGRFPRSPRQKPGVLSWWSSKNTVMGSNDGYKTSTLDSPSASRSGNNRSWLNVYPSTWSTDVKKNFEGTQPLNARTDVEMASFTGHDTTAPAATTAQGEHTIDSIEVHQIGAPRPALARCKTSSTFWTRGPNSRGSIDEEAGKTDHSLDLTEAKHHFQPQPERLVGLGDNTLWTPHARRLGSNDQLNKGHTTMGSRDGIKDMASRSGTATTSGAMTPGKNGTRMGTPAGARGKSPFLAGCNIQTETTTVVTRSSQDYSSSTSGLGLDAAQRAHALRPDTAHTDPYHQHHHAQIPSSPSYIVAEDEDEERQEHISTGGNAAPSTDSWYDRSSASHTSEDTLRGPAAGPRPA